VLAAQQAGRPGRHPPRRPGPTAAARTGSHADTGAPDKLRHLGPVGDLPAVLGDAGT
jgi:hypothetical protein